MKNEINYRDHYVSSSVSSRSRLKMADVQKSNYVEKEYIRSRKAKVFITFHWPIGPGGLTEKAAETITKTFESYLKKYTEKE